MQNWIQCICLNLCFYKKNQLIKDTSVTRFVWTKLNTCLNLHYAALVLYGLVSERCFLKLCGFNTSAKRNCFVINVIYLLKGMWILGNELYFSLQCLVMDANTPMEFLTIPMNYELCSVWLSWCTNMYNSCNRYDIHLTIPLKTLPPANNIVIHYKPPLREFLENL